MGAVEKDVLLILYIMRKKERKKEERKEKLRKQQKAPHIN